MRKNILIIEDKPSQLRLAEYKLPFALHYYSEPIGISKQPFSAGLDMVPQPDVILLDLEVTDTTYLHILQDIKFHYPYWPVIVLTSYGQEELALQALGAGASDYITKPMSLERLTTTIRNVLKMQNMNASIARLERVESKRMFLSDVVGVSENIKQAVAQAEQTTNSDIPVWIEGQPGTGKSLLAQAIHGSSKRSGRPFIEVDCAKLAEDETYAFTRAMHDVQGGTIYLKSICRLSEQFQYALLAILENRAMQDIQTLSSTCRFIMGYNLPITRTSKQKAHHTLYEQCSGNNIIALLPLRQRKEDIASLAKHFIAMAAASENKTVLDLCDDALILLESMDWPGNISQLSRTIHRAVLLCSYHELDAGTLRLIQQLDAVNYSAKGNSLATLAPTLVDIRGHVKKLKFIEEEAIRFALANCGGSMTRAARNLGIGRSTLYRKISEMIPVPTLRGQPRQRVQ